LGKANDGFEIKPYEDLLAYFLLLKTLRYVEVSRFYYKIEKILLYTDFQKIVMMKIFLTFVNIIFITHIGASAWMFVNKINNSDPKGFFFRNPEDQSDLLKSYIYSFSWAVEAMTGNSFGEVTPKTVNEMVCATVFILLGAFVYSKIYAGFD
jgi:hypothetical protein